MNDFIVKQVITAWYDPSKKVPSNSDFVVATVSGKVGEITLDHELMIASWVADEGWCFFDEDIDVESDSDLIKVDAWCDLKPYR